jgi:probable phosphoglycerate mutase
LEPIAGQYFYTVTASVGILGYEHDRTEPVIRLWNDAGIGRELTKREIEHI